MITNQPAARPATSAELQFAEDLAAKAARDAIQIEKAINDAAAKGDFGPAIAGAEAPFPPGTIVVPSGDNGPPIRLNVDGSGIHLAQGSNSTTIPIHDVVPRGAVQISYALAASVIALCIGWPIARAVARYIDRKGRSERTGSALEAQLHQRFEAMERNIDTVAVEVERMSEAQRFTSKLLNERAAVVQTPPQEVVLTQERR